MDDLACQELVELATEYLEGALGAEQRARLEHHLSHCDGCHAHLGQLRAVVRAAEALPEERLSVAAEDELVAAFRAWAAGG
jgi:anti-sigma factor RsiW